MDGFSKQVCKQLPLAESLLRLFSFVCHPEFLQSIFERYRGRSYEAVISFPLFVQLIGDALLKHRGSGHKSFRRAEESGELEASVRAAYDKLARVPLSLSMGLISEGTARLNELYPQSVARSDVPSSLKEFEVLFHDGKKLKHVARRLKALRGLKGNMLGGKVVVAQSASTNMAVAMGAVEDGETSDAPLMPDVMEQVRRLVPGPRLHVADRQFCDLIQPHSFTQDEGDHFVVRWNKKLHFHRDDNWETLTGVDRRGRTYREDWGWIGGEKDKRRLYVRRICLRRSDGEDIIILTDLLEPEQYPADDLLEVYRQRWGIEQMFQQVTEVFHLGHLIGTSPRATVFQAAFCFLVYNMIQVVKAYIAEGQIDEQKMEPREISTENLFYDVHQELISWNKVLTTKQTVEILSTTWTPAQTKRRLRELLVGLWSDLWRKAPSNTHRAPPPTGKDYLKGGHSSVFRILNEHRAPTGAT